MPTFLGEDWHVWKDENKRIRQEKYTPNWLVFLLVNKQMYKHKINNREWK